MVAKFGKTRCSGCKVYHPYQPSSIAPAVRLAIVSVVQHSFEFALDRQMLVQVFLNNTSVTVSCTPRVLQMAKAFSPITII